MLIFALSLVAGASSASSEERGGVSPTLVLARADAALDDGAGRQVVFPPRGDGGDGDGGGDDRTLAPYFYVDGGNADTDRLPLKETSASVQIAGVIARVRVYQAFENSGSKPIEAVYVFPGSTRAAIHGMRMRIGERTIEAKIDRKHAARAQYEQAKSDGKRASLLEQERPNVFTMRVANVMPRDRIEVELDYSELLVPEDAVYEFVFPTVVAPRYCGGASPSKDGWMSNPYLGEGKSEPYRFDLRAHVETAIGIKELTSPSHDITVSYLSSTSADVQLRHPGGGNKDFVLRYRLAGDKVETGMLLFEGAGENYFVMMMEPPRRPPLSQIPPREYIFLLDVSGSMHGFPLDTSKALMSNLLRQLRPTDYFNMVFFSGGSYLLSPGFSLRATASNIQAALDRFDREQGGGGTELMEGLVQAYSIPRPPEEVSRSVVLATDGQVAVESKAIKFVREHLGDANLFAFGIGSSVNRGLIEAMARAGLGEPFVVLRPERAEAQASKLREYIEQPVLTKVQYHFDGFDAVEVAPRKLPDLMARRPLVLFGKYRGPAVGTVTVRGISGEGPMRQTLAVELHTPKSDNAPIRWLWARKWVELLDDEYALLGNSPEIEKAVTRLGLDYTLLTSFTSFVAVDSEIANRTGMAAEAVKQPLPLPEGVSNQAIGGASPGAASGQQRVVQQSGLLSLLHTGDGGASNLFAPSGMGNSMNSALRSLRDSGVPDSGGVGGLGSRGTGPGPGAGLGLGGLGPRGQGSVGSYGSVTLGSPPSKRLMVMGSGDEDDDSLGIEVRQLQTSGLTSTTSLLKQLRQRLHSTARACFSASGTFRLRLTVGASGRVEKVEVIAATSAKGGQCLVRAFRKLESSTTATKAQGTLVVEVIVE